MYKIKRGQISTEYLILMGFIGFAVAGILISGTLYIMESQDKIKLNQVSQAANKIIQTSEAVYYSGEPSRLTISVYVPSGVQSITFKDNYMIINVSTSTGSNTQAYTSKINIKTQDGTNVTSSTEGIKRFQIRAGDNSAIITPK